MKEAKEKDKNQKQEIHQTNQQPNPLDELFQKQIEEKRELQDQHQFDRDEWLDFALAEKDQHLDWAYAVREYEYEERHYQENYYNGRWMF